MPLTFQLLEGVFSRCLHCNGLLRAVDKEAISDRLLPQTKQYYHEFRHCQGCDRIYWRGSHYQRIQQFIDSVLLDNLAG